ncbi:hypothetical protein KSU1_B0282 [Candidatus Jettenia caeni]|uniref:Multi-ubiquitin domain-containing protein n=1 Tax=Candidatus Jettenia caeni TaxID=247490 RepID=I3IHE4_9BACT|nr:multiubiquitin domain-containing protein [Candidatus Jettenia sp. AMX1]GAB61139.1 hypothetical protein KSU1_B0282 [Candidatus Jettenia caeni]GIL21375.1 MAG: hypothetical protein BroJett041_24890 [Candidatus Jettenia caeni]GJQ46995.1 MAG: hypothetical protein JETCAE04_27490 [Candidatus Jettenia caeni]
MKTDMFDEIIDLEEFAIEGKKPPKGCRYRIKIDKNKYVVDVPLMSGREILNLAEKTPPEQYMLFQKFRGGENKRIELDEKVDFTTPGVEKFRTLPMDQTEGKNAQTI